MGVNWGSREWEKERQREIEGDWERRRKGLYKTIKAGVRERNTDVYIYVYTYTCRQGGKQIKGDVFGSKR